MKKNKKIGPPNKLHTLFEGAIAGRDRFHSLLSLKTLKKSLPKGDKHPVLLFPGFLASDKSMQPLCNLLNQLNYTAETWQGGINWGPSDERLEHTRKRLKQIYDENGGQKVSLIGWSLGGIYVRELAREYPDMVRSVITLGTPFHAVHNPDSTVVGSLFSYVNPDIEPESIFDPNLPIIPPITSIYTKKDGIAHWKTCLLKADKKTENIEVDTSHMGLVVNLNVFKIIANRLAQPQGQWKNMYKARKKIRKPYKK